jgi:hypothetical protein
MSEAPKFDPAIQTENIAFDRGSMVACQGCRRLNPPNRLKCIYCAGKLSTATSDASTIKPVLRKLELWERGYNLIVRMSTPEADIGGAAKFLSVEIDEIAALLDLGTPMPIARVENEEEAVVVQESLSQFGIGC